MPMLCRVVGRLLLRGVAIAASFERMNENEAWVLEVEILLKV